MYSKEPIRSDSNEHHTYDSTISQPSHTSPTDATEPVSAATPSEQQPHQLPQLQRSNSQDEKIAVAPSRSPPNSYPQPLPDATPEQYRMSNAQSPQYGADRVQSPQYGAASPQPAPYGYSNAQSPQYELNAQPQMPVYTQDVKSQSRDVQMEMQQPRQYGGSQTRYENAIPLTGLSMSPAPVDCPNCKHRAVTRTEKHAGNTTHAWAFATFCLTCCLCFIPYMMDGLKDVDHFCSNCNTRLATWHKSGNVEVYAYA